MNALRSLREYFQAADARGGWQTEERPDEAGDTGVEAGDGGDEARPSSLAWPGQHRWRAVRCGTIRGEDSASQIGGGLRLVVHCRWL